MEYRATDAVSTWTSRGNEVSCLLLTYGEVGIPSPPANIGQKCSAEQRDACTAVGDYSLQFFKTTSSLSFFPTALRVVGEAVGTANVFAFKMCSLGELDGYCAERPFHRQSECPLDEVSHHAWHQFVDEPTHVLRGGEAQEVRCEQPPELAL